MRFPGFVFVVILSLNVQINLPLKLQTDHCVGKRTKSAGDQIFFSHCVCIYIFLKKIINHFAR